MKYKKCIISVVYFILTSQTIALPIMYNINLMVPQYSNMNGAGVQMAPVNQATMNTINAIHAINTINRLNAINAINQMNAMNTMNYKNG